LFTKQFTSIFLRHFYQKWQRFVNMGISLQHQLNTCMKRCAFKLLSNAVCLWSDMHSRCSHQRVNCLALMRMHTLRKLQKVLTSWSHSCSIENITVLQYLSTSGTSDSQDEWVRQQFCNAHAVVTLDDLEVVLSSHCHFLSSCFHRLKDYLASQITIVSNLNCSLDAERSTAHILQMRIDNSEIIHKEKITEFSTLLANLSKENSSLKESLACSQQEASFANESQKGAWIALQQISKSLQSLQEKYSLSLEKLSLSQQETTKYFAYQYKAESALNLLESQMKALEALFNQALKNAETESGFWALRSSLEIRTLQHENDEII
jgi:hypothetical protein